MAGPSKTSPWILSAAIFLLLEIAALALVGQSSSLQNVWINRFSHRVKGALWTGGERARNFVRLDVQNRELAEENAMLREKLRRFQLAQADSMQQAQVAALGPRDNFRFVPAEIMKVSRNTQHNYIILDKGSEDGIVPGAGIISGRGVIGLVGAVSRHYSYGMTLMNNRVSVSARIGADGVAAPLVWDGIHKDRALLLDLPLHYEVTPGDTVWTSGHSSVFPAGIPLGTTDRMRIVAGASSEVDVHLFENFSAVRYVTVAINTGWAEIETLEEP